MRTMIIIAVALLAGGLMAGVEAQDCNTLKVAVGDARAFTGTGVEVRFLEVIEDSRCPEGVDCIWAGNARIKVEVSRYHKTSVPYEMDTNGNNSSITFDGFTISLDKLDPYPKANHQMDKGEYQATLTIKSKVKE